MEKPQTDKSTEERTGKPISLAEALKPVLERLAKAQKPA